MKNTHSKLIFSVILSFAVFFIANGQKKADKERNDRLIKSSELIIVKGTVTAFNKYHIKNAEVTAKKTRLKTFTDSHGRFEISVPQGDVLLFKAYGFEKNRIKVTAENDEIIVNMILRPGEKNKKIAVGYGRHIDEQDITFAVKNYSDYNNDFCKYHNMSELLKAKFPTAKVTHQGSIQVFIRCSGHDSYMGLSENPGAALFVLNGTMVPRIDHLNPCEVRSITLLKDSGAAIYGLRGSNGVILINTK
jgi:TonB-dependent SusC/RagA subfamily outer membrane receptor